MRRAGYLAATLVLSAAATIAAAIGGRPVASVGAGVGSAWLVQAVSFWVLAGGLERGERVAGTWIAGIAGRFATGVVIWVLAALAGVPTRVLMISYGMALVVFLLLEAGWLAVLGTDRKVRGDMDTGTR